MKSSREFTYIEGDPDTTAEDGALLGTLYYAAAQNWIPGEEDTHELVTGISESAGIYVSEEVIRNILDRYPEEIRNFVTAFNSVHSDPS